MFGSLKCCGPASSRTDEPHAATPNIETTTAQRTSECLRMPSISFLVSPDSFTRRLTKIGSSRRFRQVVVRNRSGRDYFLSPFPFFPPIFEPRRTPRMRPTIPPPNAFRKAGDVKMSPYCTGAFVGASPQSDFSVAASAGSRTNAYTRYAPPARPRIPKNAFIRFSLPHAERGHDNRAGHPDFVHVA